MPSFFEQYDAVNASGLFDAEFYRITHPDVAQSNADPLTHYLERGAAEGRQPHPDFDVAYYLTQCERVGERPANPLLHFILSGAERGLRTRRDSSTEVAALPATSSVPSIVDPLSDADFRMFIDTPRIVNGAAMAPVRGALDLNGWAVARAGVASVDVSVDGVRVGAARLGIKRNDVYQALPDWSGSLHGGFNLLIPQRSLPRGTRTITVRAVDRRGVVASANFRLEVKDSLQGEGPWTLRRKIPASEVAFWEAVLSDLGWQAEFLLFIYVVGAGDALDRLRRTLETLRDQTYAWWQAFIVPSHPGQLRQGLHDVLSAFPEISEQITVVGETQGQSLVSVVQSESSRNGSAGTVLDESSWIGLLQAGDQLGCDALLRLAVAAGLDNEADLLYSDERCWDATERRLDVFFKPEWSPDLLMSRNYFGRLWCASADVWQRTSVGIGEVLKYGEYDLVLRCAEQAQQIRHIPHVLCQRGPDHIDTEATERNALVRALARRGIRGSVDPGLVSGTFDVRRQLSARPRVSIVIATCAARGLIRTCIESIRKLTDYSDYEIVCIENIPEDAHEQRSWVSRNADQMISTTEPFNWSAFNNTAANQSRGDVLVFLNDDVEVLDPDWLSRLVEQVMRPEVGVIGPMLLYPDGTIQHAGLHLSHTHGTVLHTFRYGSGEHLGYFGLAQTQRDVIGVTGACLCTRRDIFEQLDGFDPRHTVIYNDVDYCLRVWDAGLWTVYTPHVRLVHHEMASRRELPDLYDVPAFLQRWGGLFGHGDPFFSPNLARSAEHPSPEGEAIETVFCGKPLIRHETIRRVLVTKIDHIGDCITALPAIRRLKSHFPDARISVLAAPWSQPVWALEPAIDELIEFELFRQRSKDGQRMLADSDLVELAKRLAPSRFDLTIDLRKSPDTRPIVLCSGARWLAGFDHDGRFPWLDIALEWEADRWAQRKRRHVADDLIALVDAVADACADDGAVSVGSRSLTGAIMPGLPEALLSRPIVCLHPGAGTPMRQWPAEHFAILIDLLVGTHDVHVALIGSADEATLAEKIRAQVKTPASVFLLAGEVALADLPRLLAGCVLFVGNNSWPQHLAAELGVATVAIHSGVIDPREHGPRGPRTVALRRDMACSPCYLKQVAECPRDLECLIDLTPARVAQACALFLTSCRREALRAN